MASPGRLTGSLIDANVFLRHVLDDVPGQSERAHEFFASLERGDASAWTSGTVVFECVYTLQSVYRVPRAELSASLLPLLQLRNLRIEERALYPAIFSLFTTHGRLSFADCCHAVLARELGDGTIVSFDRGFDRVPGLTRIEPVAPA